MAGAIRNCCHLSACSVYTIQPCTSLKQQNTGLCAILSMLLCATICPGDMYSVNRIQDSDEVKTTKCWSVLLVLRASDQPMYSVSWMQNSHMIGATKDITFWDLCFIWLLTFSLVKPLPEVAPDHYAFWNLGLIWLLVIRLYYSLHLIWFSGEPRVRNTGQAVQDCPTGDQHQQSLRVWWRGEACRHKIFFLIRPHWNILKSS